MCCVAIIDVHASARREWPQRAAIVASEDLRQTDLGVSDVTLVVEQEVAVAHSAPRAAASRTASARADRPPSPGARLRAYTKDQVRDLIRRHARAYGLDPGLPLAIAECESGFRWNAANGRSSARGVFQYLAGTWRTTPEGRKGTSVFDTNAHVRMAVAQIAKSGTGPWNASRICWSPLTSSVDATTSETESATGSATDNATEASDPAPDDRLDQRPPG
jgi:hypothetical protein